MVDVAEVINSFTVRFILYHVLHKFKGTSVVSKDCLWGMEIVSQKEDTNWKRGAAKEIGHQRELYAGKF